jgi:hypothetical protein
MKKIQEDHKEVENGKKKDDEGYMARSELDTIDRAVTTLKKVIKKSDQQLPAWVQSKITKAADYIDTAAEYLQSDEKVEEEVSFNIDPKQIRSGQKSSKIRTLAQKGSTEGERTSAQNKRTGPSIPLIRKGDSNIRNINAGYEPSLVEKILEDCGCSSPKCNKTPAGKMCPKHGMDNCSVSEEVDPKGPTKPYSSPAAIAKKHGVSIDAINKQLELGIKVESEHTSSKSAARGTALQHLDELPDYYTKLNKMEKKKTKNESVTIEDCDGNPYVEFVDLIKPDPIKSSTKKDSELSESIRLSAQNGHIIAVTLSWRGKYYSLKTFFPQTKIPNRKEVDSEIQKIYPGARVVVFGVSDLSPGQPIMQVQNSKSKNYLLNNKTIGEEVEIGEGKKSEMPCNKPKAEAHGSGETGKSHVVKACEGGKEKLIRFGQKGVKGSPKKKGESEEYASRRHRFQSRHAKNIAKGKMSAAYWANKVKW